MHSRVQRKSEVRTPRMVGRSGGDRRQDAAAPAGREWRYAWPKLLQSAIIFL